ncbi:MAG: class I SAM-dependent methyltransferase [Candidatus Eremiobacteraeota bacterium]|nr:class I SAM-dependent methyltransferase [Candidatus Eremiobacteraeota bacterium]
MPEIDFIGEVHNRTKRNYVQRVIDYDKAECAAVAKQYAFDYWDGDRRYGYGGYNYDGRWRGVAERMARHYGLKPGDRILDVGCGKGYLLYEFAQVVPGIEIAGADVSAYAVEHAKEEVKDALTVANATQLPYPDKSFDFIVSLGALHCLPFSGLFEAIAEIERVGKNDRKYLMVESFRDEREKANLLYWQLTCDSFHSADEWPRVLASAGYHGDYGFIFFT